MDGEENKNFCLWWIPVNYGISPSLQFPCTFFDGRADMCASLCYEILKCCNSKLSSIRSDAAHLLYFLMKSNFDYTGRRSFVRTHLQVLVCMQSTLVC